MKKISHTHKGPIKNNVTAINHALSESMVLKSCIEWLYVNGCAFIRNNTGAFKQNYSRKDGSTGSSWIRFGKKGSGDIICCTPNGRYLEVETKRYDGVLSPEQEDRQRLIESKGGLYIVARSIDDLESRKAEILGKLPDPVAYNYTRDFKVKERPDA